MVKDVTIDKEFYNARMNLLENMEGSDRQEMYRDINDLREEIVKILHEFGADKDKDKTKQFSIDKNLSEHASRRAYSKKKPEQGSVSDAVTHATSSDSTNKLLVESNSPKSYDVELRGQNQHNAPLEALSHNWAKTICKRLEHISSSFQAPLASNGYQGFYGLHKIRSITPPRKRHSGRYQRDAESNEMLQKNSPENAEHFLYSSDTLFEAISKLKVAADKLHREAAPSLFDSDEIFRHMGSKNYYQSEMRELLEYGCSMIPKCLALPTIPEVLDEYSDLLPIHAQIGVDDVTQDSYYITRLQEGRELLKSQGSAEQYRKYSRKGVPAELRSNMWAAALGIEIDPISTAKKKWLASLHKKRRASKMLIEQLIEEDINSVLDSDHYFPFEDILKSTLFAFFLDERVNTLCKGESSSRPRLYGFGESGNSHGLYPPCGILPFCGMSWYAAPLTFLFGFQMLTKAIARPTTSASSGVTSQDRHSQRPFSASSLKGRSSQIARERKRSESILQKSQEKQKRELSNNAKQVEEHARCYFTFRALYCRHFCKLHTAPYDGTSGLSPSLLGLCQLFEDLMERMEPEVNYHLYANIGISSLALAFPWIVHGFAQVLVPEQVLLLWDRVVGFDSLLPLVLLSCAMFHFRKEEILQCQNLDEINLFLDFRDVQVLPILQMFLQHMQEEVAENE